MDIASKTDFGEGYSVLVSGVPKKVEKKDQRNQLRNKPTSGLLD